MWSRSGAARRSSSYGIEPRRVVESHEIVLNDHEGFVYGRARRTEMKKLAALRGLRRDSSASGSRSVYQRRVARMISTSSASRIGSCRTQFDAKRRRLTTHLLQG